MQDTVINFAFDSERSVIGKLLVPSNSLAFNTTGTVDSELQMLQRVQTYPVPDSVLEGVLNEISDSRIPYITRTFSLVNNTYLSRAKSMVSPAVLIEV